MSNTYKTGTSCGCGHTGRTAIQPIESLEAPKGKGSLRIQFLYIDLSLCTR